MADASAQEAGHLEVSDSEPPSPPTLHSLPTEDLTMIFRFVVVYDEWDRGPLQKRTTQSLHEIATFSRLCKKFNKVIHHGILYQLIQFPRELSLDDEQDPDGSPPRSDPGQEQDAHPPHGVDELRLKRMEKLHDLFWERSDLRDLVLEAPAADDPRETPFTLSPTVDPEYSLPCLKFLSIHCSNILMVCHGESRKILEDVIFTSCPKIESLEVTGIKAEPEMIHRVLLPLERGIIRTGRSLARPNLRNVQESLPGLMNLAKVTLVTANATETLWLFTKVTCRVYLESFASAGVQLALVRRGTKFLKADFVRPFVEQVLSLA
ncbi:hypothetical protein QBC37DRAFT_375693 [Rhypophila decipiens]|uniref:F-box domain-containing protein n=1 Tax=Rhypophila decipiens TaxID=261697 RepID=A0AAN6Y3E2_9PEZI|nr:hypothetical protein QBC37DRAFT_375693 [Rhypophila decipiens]